MVDIKNLSQLPAVSPNGFIMGAESGDAAFPSLYPISAIREAIGYVSVDDFGAKGDAQFRTGTAPGAGTILAGSKNFSFSVDIFAASDVGKTIWIEKAGTAGDYHVTTIATFTSPKIITVTDPAITTVNNAQIKLMWATDDTAAFNAAIASTVGEVRLNPNKTYAVNLNLAKRGTILNGCTGAYQHTLTGSITNNVYNIIPFDRTKPAIQIGDGTGYAGGILLENMVIYNPLYTVNGVGAATSGNVGIYLGPGCYGNHFQNLSITEFTDCCIKAQGADSVAIGNYNNHFTNCSIGIFSSNIVNTAVLGLYYGTNGSGVTSLYFSNMIIRGPSPTGGGLTFYTQGAKIQISQAFVQWSITRGAKFESIVSGASTQYGNLICQNVEFEGVDTGTPGSIICESTYDLSNTLTSIPPIYGSFSISGRYKNSAGVESIITNNNGYTADKTVILTPTIQTSASVINTTTGNKITAFSLSGASDNFVLGDTATNRTYIYGCASNSSGTGVFLIGGGVTQLQAFAVDTASGTGYIRPGSDNKISVGTSSLKWSVVYAATGTINTSDERMKCDFRSVTEKEKAVAIKLKSLLKAFKFKDSVAEKGDKARWHFGVIAQEVDKAFSAEGLDARDYALFCYDEWKEEPAEYGDNGEIIRDVIQAGNSYGIRYDELFAFIIAAM